MSAVTVTCLATVGAELKLAPTMQLRDLLLFFKKPQEPNQSKPNSHNSDKRKALRAFRSIALMLSLIQSRNRITGTPRRSHTDKAELRPLDALAAIAIRKHGIAAVVAKTDDGLEDIQVLASFSSDHDKGLLTLPTQSPLPSGKASKSNLSFLYTRNPRSSQKTPKEPIIVDPETMVPELFTKCGDKDLFKTYLKHEW
jgi:hypothetical protein